MLSSRRWTSWLSRSLLLAAALSAVACADNATKLANAFKKPSQGLDGAPNGSSVAVDYEPKTAADTPYSVLLLPRHPTTEADLVAAGVPAPVATEVFSSLAYVEIDQGGLLVVHQPGQRLTFTSYWRRFAELEDLLYWSGSGPLTVVLTKKDGRVVIEELR